MQATGNALTKAVTAAEARESLSRATVLRLTGKVVALEEWGYLSWRVNGFNLLVCRLGLKMWVLAARYLRMYIGQGRCFRRLVFACLLFYFQGCGCSTLNLSFPETSVQMLWASFFSANNATWAMRRFNTLAGHQKAFQGPAPNHRAEDSPGT